MALWTVNQGLMVMEGDDRRGGVHPDTRGAAPFPSFWDELMQAGKQQCLQYCLLQEWKKIKGFKESKQRTKRVVTTGGRVSTPPTILFSPNEPCQSKCTATTERLLWWSTASCR